MYVDEEKTNKEKTKQRETNFKKKAKQGEEEGGGKVNFRDKKGEEYRTWGKKG
jgi:hypothetical protein